MTSRRHQSRARAVRFGTPALLLGVLLTSASLPAQPSPGAVDARVHVALVETLPVRTASAMIVRKTGQLPVVVLDRKHADPATLGMALALLRTVRKTPLAAGQQQVIPIQGGVAHVAPSAERWAFLQRQLRSLRARPVGRIGALGRGQFIEVTDNRIANPRFSRS